MNIEELHMKIGQNVKKLREEKGLSQLELSHAIGHTSSTIVSQAEIAGRKKFNIEHLLKISEVLECDIKDFFNFH